MMAPTLRRQQETPILLGKLKSFPSGRRALIAGEGMLASISREELGCLYKMDGRRTFEEVAEASRQPLSAVRELYERLAGPKALDLVAHWNRLHWHRPTRTYQCLQNGPLDDDTWAYIPLDPPCDPWICFTEERRLISELIERQRGKPLPEGALVLANNCLLDGKFYWQIVIDGRVVMNIHFADQAPDSWHADFLPGFDQLDWDALGRNSLETEIERTVAANLPHSERLAEDALVFIEETTALRPGVPLVYFSGGKESMVMKSLFERLDIPANLVFGGVGLDFPEDNAFISRMEEEAKGWDKLRLHVVHGDAEAAWQGLEENGEITLTNTWCRQELKYPNRDRLVRELYPEDTGYIAFEGSRWYENDFRRSHPRVQLVKIPGYSRSHYWGMVLGPWTGLDIWTHILHYDLPVNPLYYEGFQRTTCWICPLVNPYHLHRSRELYPELWQRAAKLTGQQAPGDGFRSGDALLNPF